MRVSIAIPCYNESKNLPLLVNRCSEVSRGRNIEFILVDNGSSDDTIKYLRNYCEIKKISFQPGWILTKAMDTG